MDHGFEDRCPECRGALIRGRLDCARCQRALVSDEAVECARGACRRLLGRVYGSPYFRSVGLLGYTLRGKVQGFLDDPGHPLARDLLHFLWSVGQATQPPSGTATSLLREHAIDQWIRPEAPLLVPAVDYVAQRHGERLADLRTGEDFRQWYRRLLDVPEGT